MDSDQRRAIKVLNDNAAQIEELYHRLESNPSHPAWPQVEQAIAAHREAGTALKDGQPSAALIQDALAATEVVKQAVDSSDDQSASSVQSSLSDQSESAQSTEPTATKPEPTKVPVTEQSAKKVSKIKSIHLIVIAAMIVGLASVVCLIIWVLSGVFSLATVAVSIVVALAALLAAVGSVVILGLLKRS